MKAHFIASALNIDQKIDCYREIIATLEANGVELSREWVENAYTNALERGSGTPQDEITWQQIYDDNLSAISKSDIVVAEVSDKSFFVGFQVSTAIQLKKPTLLLSDQEQADSILGAQLSEENLEFHVYDESNLGKILDEFIEKNHAGTKDIRFNFFITRRMLGYLNWAAKRSSKTKSQIIRDMIEYNMRDSDFR